MKGNDRHRRVGKGKERERKSKKLEEKFVHAAQRESTYYLGITLATRL